MKNGISIYGNCGDPLTTPENTIIGFWSAIGAGADGLVTSVRLTKDKQLVCSDCDSLEKTCGISELIKDMDYKDIRLLDAGSQFRSVVLKKDNQPSKFRGEDMPWIQKNNYLQTLPLLNEVLVLFARRTFLGIKVPPDKNTIDLVIHELMRFGIMNKTFLILNKEGCHYLFNKGSKTKRVLSLYDESNIERVISTAHQLESRAILLDWNKVRSSIENSSESKKLQKLTKMVNVDVWLDSPSFPFTVPRKYFNAIPQDTFVKAILTRGIFPTIESLNSSALIISESFKGKVLNTELWTGGFSHVNQDTSILHDDGLIISIKEGGTYSGSAVICKIPIHDKFDVRVAFHVSNPMQGTTFELAAIAIDPGNIHLNNIDLNTRNVNLTFDVHGAPPYASSECDESDGYRCGWNNSYNLTKFNENWNAASANMYNKYGRDIGTGTGANSLGKLRLTRNGNVFSSYYQDRYNTGWVCSGSMLVPAMPKDCFIRLAAKHWSKGEQIPPSNNISFRDFQLFQPSY